MSNIETPREAVLCIRFLMLVRVRNLWSKNYTCFDDLRTNIIEKRFGCYIIRSMRRMLVFYWFLVFICCTHNSVFAKSCLSSLGSDHHALLASYDEKDRCIIKSCIVSYKLFHNKCYEKDEYEKLVAQEKDCVDSGGKYDYINGIRLKCFCPDDKSDVDGKCILYHGDSCDAMTQHVERNNLDPIKKCVGKNTGLVKGLAQPAIETAIKTHDYRILDYLLDNGLDLEETTHATKFFGYTDIPIINLIDQGVYSEYTTSYHKGNPENTFEQTNSENTVDLSKNFDLIKHLVDDKKAIDLKKQYSVLFPFSKDSRYFLDIVALNQNEYASGDSLSSACETLDFLLQKGALYRDIMHDIILDKSGGARDHRGFPFEYLKCARDKGIKFKLIDDRNPLEILQGTHNLKAEQYDWLITEVKKDLPDVDFTNALRTFCEYDYSYGPPPRKMQEEIDIMELFLDAGAQINDDILKAAKYKQEYTNKNVSVYDDGSDNSNWFSHKFDAICSFVPENELCITGAKALEEESNEYDKAKEQSLANRVLDGVSSAAMGIGAMQMAQGLSEQKADKEAEADMRQYLNTFTCTYGAKAQTVKFGPEDVTLDAGADLVKYATEYRGLAERLKKTKKALNLTPGIEEEEIIDPATSGLYSYTPMEKKDGQYTSLSKAILDEESEDAKEWEAQKSKSKKRVIGGAVALGAGVVGSVVSNSIKNNKLGEMIKENKNKKSVSNTNKSVINKLKTGLKLTGMTNVDNLDFSNLDLSSMSEVIDKIDFSSMSGLQGKNATEILNTSNSDSFTSSFGKILGEKNALLFQ